VKTTVVPTDWWKVYGMITRELHLDPMKDRESTRTLSLMLTRLGVNSKLNFKVASEIVMGKDVVVFGAGPSLTDDLKKFETSKFRRNTVLIAADGAARPMFEHNLAPELIVSDLDGCPACVKTVTKSGGVGFVHAHGDNMELLTKWIPELGAGIVGTTQVEPVKNVFNFEGFTDGDRAVYIAVALGAREVILAGMDLGSVVSKYSKPWLAGDSKASEFKRRKLKWAKYLLERIARRSDVKFYNATSHGVNIKGYRRIDFHELR
jgi:uncharacterized Rossmann fold enzyme